MTSLSRQLEGLREAVSAQLGVERSYTSLLFETKEAKELCKEDAFRLGQVGLVKLRKIDSDLARNEEDLFSETALTLQRVLLSKEENAKLNGKIDSVLIQIAPYLLHFAAQQVLEWLIFRYQIQTFNAERLFVTFLPFHSTNIFGRLLSILDLKGIEYDWVKEYAKVRSPIPFEKIVTKCFSANHSTLSMVSRSIEYTVQTIGCEFVEKKFPQLFAFYAKLGVHLVSDSTKINDALISKLMPFLARGFKSRLPSLRLSSLMIASQLCLSVTLTEPVIHSLLKLVLLKISVPTVEATINAVVVLCQRQSVKSLPPKGIKKLIRKSEEMKIMAHISTLSKITDLTRFLEAIWRAAFPLFQTGDEEELNSKVNAFLIDCLDPKLLDKSLAASLFSLVFETVAAADGQRTFPKGLRKHIRTLVLRFGSEFDTVRAEWSIRDDNIVKAVMKMCRIEDHEVGDIGIGTPSSEKKRRRRNSSSRKSICEGEPVEEFTAKKPNVSKAEQARSEAEEQIASLKEKPKAEFKGDPLEKLGAVIDAQDWAKAAVGLEKLVSEKYLKRHSAADFEEFITEMIKRANADALAIKADIRNALAQLPLTSEFSVILLKRPDSAPNGKRARTAGGRFAPPEYFAGEEEADFEKRILFVLEVFNASKSVRASGKLLSQLFDILKRAIKGEGNEGSTEFYMQQLTVSLLVRLLKNPQGYIVTKGDLQLDCIVETIRGTLNQRTLRDCLRLLTAAVSISADTVITHAMSVFTFMGAGLLKKDNDLTLGIIEETLSVLFKAVMDEKHSNLHGRLISVARIFAASVIDIPAHRRIRILRGVAYVITAKHICTVIAVLFEHYCLNWQKGESYKGRATVEQFEEMASELVSVFDAAEQLLCAINLVNYIVRLGGDFDEEGELQRSNADSTRETEKIFDRTAHSMQKIRHYRFTIIGWIARLLAAKDLFDKLCEMDDITLYERLMPVGKRMLVTTMELDDFVTKQSDDAERRDIRSGQPSITHHFKYWLAFASRADIVSEKFRNLLPASVSGRLIADVLEDNTVSPKMRDRALQLLNVKLMQDGLFRRDGGIQLEHLSAFAAKLNTWIKPGESAEEMLLCQNAAFSLKLIAKRIPTTENSEVLTESVKLCKNLLSQWRSLDEAMVGNVLLLAGELLRSHSMRSTLLASDALARVCLEILNQQLDGPPPPLASLTARKSATPEPDVPGAKRKRVAQQSMSGRRIGGDILLVCALTCLQRVLDQFAQFVSAYYSQILVAISRLSVRYDPRFVFIGVPNEVLSTASLSSVQHRINQIRKALTKVEMRVILEPFECACEELLDEPKAEVFLFSLLSSCLEVKDRLILLRVLTASCDLFLTGFDLRARNQKPESYESTADCEGRLIDSFLRVVDCLSENEFRPIVKRLRNWMEPAIKSEDTVVPRTRIITTFNVLNRFYKSYGALALPHFGSFFEMVPILLTRSNGHSVDASSLLFSGKKGSIQSLEANSLITLVINFVEECAKHPEFFFEERANLVLGPLVDELDNSVVWGHEGRCVPHLANCLFQMADAQNSMISEMSSKILLKTRSASPKIRYRSLLVIEKIFDRMGDAVATLLPSVLPFLSELLEDESKKVEEQADKILSVLRKKFGEGIAEGYI